MILTAAQILLYMKSAGFPETVAVTMTAIALRESAGDPNAFNGDPATGDRSYGLLQINMKSPQVAALINQTVLHGGDEKLLLDPATNAKAGFLLWGGNNKNLEIAWYINRGLYQTRYEAHLPAAQSAALGL